MMMIKTETRNLLTIQHIKVAAKILQELTHTARSQFK